MSNQYGISQAIEEAELNNYISNLDLKTPIELEFLMLSGTIFQGQPATYPRETADLLGEVLKNRQKKKIIKKEEPESKVVVNSTTVSASES